MKRALSENTGDFWVNRRVKVLDNPSSIEFMREAVCSYEPVLIRGIVDHWAAMHKWDLQTLCEELRKTPSSAADNHHSDRLLKVNITPDGHGDCIKNILSPGLDPPSLAPYFVYPAECLMTSSVFMEMMLNRREGDAVPYLSLQNDNLRQDMPELLSDIEPSIPIANEAFGLDGPEAINLWIGDERSVSSIHKDHFENMYAVISGEKTFTLLPPTDVAFLQEAKHPTLRYALKSESIPVQRLLPVQQEPRALEEEEDSSVVVPVSLLQNEEKEEEEEEEEGSSLSPPEPSAGTVATPPVPGGAPVEPPVIIERRITLDDIIVTSDGVATEQLSWICTDPEVNPEDITYDPSDPSTNFALAHPVKVNVQAGEVLYIPAMWYHRVSQTKLTIAVNYWYDQRFDFRYAFHELAKSMRDQEIIQSLN